MDEHKQKIDQRINELYIIVSCLMPDATGYDVFDRSNVAYGLYTRFQGEVEKYVKESERLREGGR